MLKDRKNNRKQGSLIAVILLAALTNALLLSSVSVINIDNPGVDLASPLVEKAVRGHFDLPDAEDITRNHLESIYSIEFRLSDYHESMEIGNGYYALAVNINEGLMHRNGVYVNPVEAVPELRITCDVIEPIIFMNRYNQHIFSVPGCAELFHRMYETENEIFFTEDRNSIFAEEYLTDICPDNFISTHISHGRNADTRDISLFTGLRTLIFSDRIKSRDISVYSSEKYAVIERSE